MSKPGLRTKKIVEIKAVPPYRFFSREEIWNFYCQGGTHIVPSAAKYVRLLEMYSDVTDVPNIVNSDWHSTTLCRNKKCACL